MEALNLIVYVPLSWSSISTKTFRSFLDMMSKDNLDELEREHNLKTKILIHDKFPLDRNRNNAVELMLSSQYEADYILFCDADQVFPKNTIKKLFSNLSDEFPCVTGLYWKKAPPHLCVAGHYSPWTKEMELKRKSLESLGYILPDGSQCLYYRSIKDFDTIQPVDVTGMGCFLCKAEIFLKIEMPYFGYINPYNNGGDYFIDHASEEMMFFAKLKKAGIKVLCDPSVRCGHVVEKIIGCSEVDQ